MGLSIGLVGLPNVGKSTTFNALTKAQNAESANYPFCTIEPNRAVVPVPDKRLDELARLFKPRRRGGPITSTNSDFGGIFGQGLGKGWPRPGGWMGLGNQGFLRLLFGGRTSKVYFLYLFGGGMVLEGDWIHLVFPHWFGKGFLIWTPNFRRDWFGRIYLEARGRPFLIFGPDP